jgi:hypothetical protein
MLKFWAFLWREGSLSGTPNNMNFWLSQTKHLFQSPSSPHVTQLPLATIKINQSTNQHKILTWNNCFGPFISLEAFLHTVCRSRVV